MNSGHKISLLGTGLIGMFYTMTLHKYQSRHRIMNVFSRSKERAVKFAGEWDIHRFTTDLKSEIN